MIPKGLLKIASVDEFEFKEDNRFRLRKNIYHFFNHAGQDVGEVVINSQGRIKLKFSHKSDHYFSAQDLTTLESQVADEITKMVDEIKEAYGSKEAKNGIV